MKESESCSTIAFIGTLLIIAAVLLDGFILSVVWNWFMPLIFGLPELSIAESLAVSLVASLFVGSKYESKSKIDSLANLVGMFIGLSVLKLTLVLGFGWILLQYVN